MRLSALLILCISGASKLSVATDELSPDNFFEEDSLPGIFSNSVSIERIQNPPLLANQDQDLNILSGASSTNDGCSAEQLQQPRKIRARQNSFCHQGSTPKTPDLEEPGASNQEKPPPVVPHTTAPLGDPDSVDLEESPAKSLILKDICPEKFGSYNTPACSSIKPGDTVCAGGICALNNCERSMSSGNLRDALASSLHRQHFDF